MKIVPADDTIADLKKKAAEYEAQARKEAGTMAARPPMDRRAQEWQVDALRQSSTVIRQC